MKINVHLPGVVVGNEVIGNGGLVVAVVGHHLQHAFDGAIHVLLRERISQIELAGFHQLVRLGIRLGRRSVHVDIAVEVVLRGHEDQGQPVLLAGLGLNLQRGEASGGVEDPQTGADFVAIQRLPGFLRQQLPKHFRVGALDTAELDGLNGDALVLTQFAKRRGKIGLGSRRPGILTAGQGPGLRPRLGTRRVRILTRGQGPGLRPRQGYAQYQHSAERRNFME